MLWSQVMTSVEPGVGHGTQLWSVVRGGVIIVVCQYSTPPATVTYSVTGLSLINKLINH